MDLKALKERLLLIPGPTNLSERVREVMARPQIGHVSQEFYNEFIELLRLARYVFRNEKGLQYVFTGSGTLAMEASVVSIVSHGDRTLVLNTGYFGKRFFMLNEVHGAKVDQIQYKDGKHADPDDLRRKLRENKYKAVFITHIDTSTGIDNPVRELVDECKKAGVFSVVDSVCGIGGVEFDFDRLGADIVFTASQKAIAAPPGALLIALSNEIYQYFQSRERPIESYYLNLLRWKPIMDDPKIYLATPAVQVLLALKEALSQIKEEGIERRWERHKKIGSRFRDAMSDLGLEFVAEDGYRADTVTGFWVDEGKAQLIQKMLIEKYNIEVARGLFENSDKMIRVGHFGNLTFEQLEFAIDSIKSVLVELGLYGKGKPKLAQTAKDA